MSHVRGFFIVAVTVCISVGSITTSEIEKQLNILRKLNKGPYANPMLDVKTQDERALVNIIRTGYNELKCSYLFRVLLHLKLTKDLATSKTKSDEKDSVSFINEGRQMLEIMNHIYIDQLRSNISILKSELSIFWIFAMYNERVRRYLTNVSYNTEEEEVKKSLICIHGAVTQLFEECLDECTAYDQHSGLPLEEGFFLDEIDERVSAAKDRESRIRLIDENKTEFNKQVDDNIIQLIPVQDKYKDPLKMNCTCLNNVHDSDEDMTTLIQHLGMFDKKSQISIVNKLNVSFKYATSTTVPLHSQMYGLGRFQQDFIEILKAVALRIAYKYLECLKKKCSKLASKKGIDDFECQTNEMHTVLTGFFEYFNLAACNDLLKFNHIVRVINDFSKPTDKLNNKRKINELMEYINRALVDIREKTNIEFSLTYYDVNIVKRKKKNNFKYINHNELAVLANEYQIQPINGDGDKLLEENVLRGKIFIKFIREKFDCSNFHFIWSYSDIMKSTLVEKLWAKEKIMPRLLRC